MWRCYDYSFAIATNLIRAHGIFPLDHQTNILTFLICPFHLNKAFENIPINY